MIKTLIAIFLGGGIGSVMRYGIQMLAHEHITLYQFPWATFTVNIVGSFMIGLFYAVSDRFGLSDSTRLFLTAGMCGGFTTFSTFSADNMAMLRQGSSLLCLIYVALSVILGLMACMAGSVLLTSRS